jgi:glucose/arabinose dehydrogenase
MGIRKTALLAALVLTLPRGALAAVPTDFVEQLIASGLDSPVGMAFLPDGRALVVEQVTANIEQLSNGGATVLTTVPDVDGQVERGLLGIAVDPAWPSRPYLYVYLSHGPSASIHIARFTVGGDLANTGSGLLSIDPSQRFEVLAGIPDNYPHHNGGTLRFGTDGKLYLSLGDDGGECLAQDPTSLRGAILRFDVSGLPSGPGGPPSRASLVPADNPYAGAVNVDQRLVWANGFRNPFRFTVDRQTGQLFVGDVGQDTWEEVDLLVSGGANCGWPWMEGDAPFTSCSESAPPLLAPIHVYPHDGMTSAIIGGPLYRRVGAQPFPQEYNGSYFYCDYYAGNLTRLVSSSGSWAIAPAVPGQPTSDAWGTGFDFVSDFQVAPDGAIWCCHQGSGEITRIVYTGLLGVPTTNRAPRPPSGIFDVQGRRLERGDRNGIYFRPGKKKVAVVK